MNTNEHAIGGKDAGPSLRIRPERRLVRSTGSRRHVELTIHAPSLRENAGREPVSLALVIDRSGSMSGEKIETAKKATMAVIESLGEDDRASIVIFDNHVDILVPEGRVDSRYIEEARLKVAQVRARASTALHEGWLTGCRSIASNLPGPECARLSRCFLLTDGLANQGLTDPEAIAEQAAEVRKNAGISTSTFGIGTDYDEGLLGPMAVAGAGQFHHLRHSGDILATFRGELGELFRVVVRNLRIRIEFDPGMQAELVSQYWNDTKAGTGRIQIAVGDLIAGEERHLVLGFRFPPASPGMRLPIRVQLLWTENGGDRETSWEHIVFEGASHEACDRERPDPEVLHWVGLHHAARARKEALDLYRVRDIRGANKRIDGVLKRLSTYADGDEDLVRSVEALKSMRIEMDSGEMNGIMVRESMYETQMFSRGQRDHRER